MAASQVGLCHVFRPRGRCWHRLSTAAIACLRKVVDVLRKFPAVSRTDAARLPCAACLCIYRYLLYAEGREDLSRLSLDQLLGRAESAAEDATRDFGRAAFEGGEGIGEAGDRLRKSSVGRALSDDGSSRLSDGSRTGYSGKEVKSNIKGAVNDLDDVANDVAGR